SPRPKLSGMARGCQAIRPYCRPASSKDTERLRMTEYAKESGVIARRASINKPIAPRQTMALKKTRRLARKTGGSVGSRVRNGERGAMGSFGFDAGMAGRLGGIAHVVAGDSAAGASVGETGLAPSRSTR